VPALYVIADAGVLGRERVLPAVAEAVEAGVEWIQLRAKGEDDRALLKLTEGAAEIVAGSNSELWINDRADIAALVPGVMGLHLGQDDLPPTWARRVLDVGKPGRRQWIGRSTHNREQLVEAAEDSEVDLIAIGPIFSTTSKADAEPVVGLEELRWARNQTDKPLVAIGGIEAMNLGDVLEAGADSVAVLGAACRGSVANNCRELLSRTDSVKSHRASAEGGVA